MSDVKRIVITGGSRGIGFALAEEFLRFGCRVVVTGRSEERLRHAAGMLEKRGEGIFTVQADATRSDDAESVWRRAVECMGGVDVWINNAGVGQEMLPVWDTSPATVKEIIDTNVSGVIYGCRAAFRGMRSQGHGCVFNMEGFGSDGRHMNNLTVYGASKRAVRYLSEGMAREAAGSGVLIGTLSPGMVATDFLLEPLRRDPERLRRALRVLNILADTPETVARFIVPRVLRCRRQNARIVWLTGRKLFIRFLSAPFTKRNIITL